MSERTQSVTLQYGVVLVILGALITVMLWITSQFSDIRMQIFELNKKVDLHIATTIEKAKP